MPRLAASAERHLEACLLPALPWEEALALQERLVYEMGEAPRRRGTLLIGEHPPLATVGRRGRATDLSVEGVRWVWTHRGGGVWLHGPGQMAIYPIVPVPPSAAGVAAHRAAIYGALVDLLAEFDIAAEARPRRAGVYVQERRIAAVGVAVKGWVSYHGCVLNVTLPPERLTAFPGRPETCLLRERVLPVRPTALREAAARHFARRLGFDHYVLAPPPLALARPSRKPSRDAAVR